MSEWVQISKFAFQNPVESRWGYYHSKNIGDLNSNAHGFETGTFNKHLWVLRLADDHKLLVR